MTTDDRVILLTMLAMSAVTAFHVAQWIRAAMLAARRRSRRLCLSCGYNLNGNVSGRCPECGHPREDLPRRASDRTY